MGQTVASKSSAETNTNGNTLTGGGKVNTWDSQNRLVRVVKAGVTSEFTYGCDGLRRRSVVTNTAGEATQTDYVYDGTMMVAETIKHYNSSNAQVGSTDNVTYLQGPSGPLYRCTASPTCKPIPSGMFMTGWAPWSAKSMSSETSPRPKPTTFTD